MGEGRPDESHRGVFREVHDLILLPLSPDPPFPSVEVVQLPGLLENFDVDGRCLLDCVNLLGTDEPF